MQLRQWVASGIIGLSAVSLSHAAPFGGDEDTGYAGKLWAAMVEAGLVGEGAIMSTPYTGVHPHGAILDTLDTHAMVDGERNILIIKRNYGGEGVDKQRVANDPEKWLEEYMPYLLLVV